MRFERNFTGPRADAAALSRGFPFDRHFGDEERARTLSPDIEAVLARAEAELLHEQRTAEIAEARESARAEGFAAGHAAACAEQDQAILSALDALHAALEDARRWQAEQEAALSADAARLALAAAEHIAGHALRTLPTGAVQQALETVMRQIPRGEEVRVHIHPDLLPAMAAHVARMQAGDRRRLNIALDADAALERGDARLEWHGGAMVLNAALRRAALLAELQAITDRLPPPEAAPVPSYIPVPDDDPAPREGA